MIAGFLARMLVATFTFGCVFVLGLFIGFWIGRSDGNAPS